MTDLAEGTTIDRRDVDKRFGNTCRRFGQDPKQVETELKRLWLRRMEDLLRLGLEKEMRRTIMAKRIKVGVGTTQTAEATPQNGGNGSTPASTQSW